VPVAAPADKRFRRVRARPARRRSPWVTRALTAARLTVAVVVPISVGWYGAQVVASSPTLHVSNVRVRGIEHLSRGEVLALLGDLQGQHILETDLDEWHARLLRSPWVAQAALRRVLPSTIEVFVGERVPIAIGRLGSDLYLVDESGVVIDEYGPNYAAFDLPIVDGLVARPRGGGEAAVVPERAALASALLETLSGRPDLGARVSQIDVANPRDAVVLLDGDRALLHLGYARFAERLDGYLEMNEALRARVPEIEYVDLRFEGRMYVRPAKGPDVRRASAMRTDRD
jgi:cell division protein FtsQ